MVSKASSELARRATAIYEQHLKSRLEAIHRDDFVAIEPDSGDYFIGSTLSEAIQGARAAYPDRLSFVIRIGHETAIEVGVLVS